MYKFIYNGNVIDVVDNIRYLRYLRKSKRIVGSDSSSANCVQASNGVDVYGIQGTKLPEYLDYPHVIIRKIDQHEFNQLKKLIDSNTKITADSYQLYTARNEKIQELESFCKQVITEGIVIKLSDDKLHSFELTIEDQLNLAMMHNKILQGAESCMYHEKEGICKLYSKEDLLGIIRTANKHIEYNTTYFNLLKNCIHNMYSIEAIQAIHYGDQLPNADYRDILNQV